MAVLSIAFSDLIAEMGYRLGYTIADDSFVTTDEVKLALNEGLLDAVVKTGVLRSQWTFSTVADQARYGFDTFSDFIRVDPNGGVVYYSGSSYTRLAGKTLTWLDRNIEGGDDKYEGDWRSNVSGTPEYYVLEQIKGIWHIRFYPKPNYSGTNNATIHGVQKPEKLINNTDTIEGSIAEYWELSVLYAMIKARRKEGEDVRAREISAEYMGRLTAMNAEKRRNKDADRRLFVRRDIFSDGW